MRRVLIIAVLAAGWVTLSASLPVLASRAASAPAGHRPTSTASPSPSSSGVVDVSAYFDPATVSNGDVTTLVVTATRVSGGGAGEIRVDVFGEPLYWAGTPTDCSEFDGIPQDEPYWVTCPIPAGRDTVTYRVGIQLYAEPATTFPYQNAADVTAFVGSGPVAETYAPYTITGVGDA